MQLSFLIINTLVAGVQIYHTWKSGRT